jgi:hypothetical protein
MSRRDNAQLATCDQNASQRSDLDNLCYSKGERVGANLTRAKGRQLGDRFVSLGSITCQPYDSLKQYAMTAHMLTAKLSYRF